MEEITKVILKDKEITNKDLVGIVTRCLVETGGIQHVNESLSELGYTDFSNKAYSQLNKSKQTQVLDFSEYSSNEFLVICIVIFAMVKEVEGDTLIQTSFGEGIELLRGI